MPNKVLYEMPRPFPKQLEFFRANTRYIGYGGARGGGKSWAIRHKAALLALRYPKIKIGIFRRTYPELLENHIKPLIIQLASVARYRYSDKEFRFVNGSTIKMLYADNERDIARFQGQEYDIIMIDEATQIPWEWFKIIDVCVRGVNRFPKRTYITCNPGGVGHAWVKRLFVSKDYRDGERAEDYTFTQASVRDNAALLQMSPEYIRNLESLPKKLRDAWLYGSWDLFEGQFFEEFIDDADHYFDRRWTNVIEPFEVPSEWKIFRSFDWGFSKPFSCAWWAVDYDDNAYLILEYYGCTGEPDVGLKYPAPKVFGEIARIEREHRWLRGKQIEGVADSAIWASDGGPAIIEAADAEGVFFQKSDKQRIPGWMQVHYRLAFDEDGRTKMQFFNTCKQAIRTITTLQYSRTVPEDLDTTGEDHFADAMRYFCMMRPVAPRHIPKAPVSELNPLDADFGKRYRNFDYL